MSEIVSLAEARKDVAANLSPLAFFSEMKAEIDRSLKEMQLAYWADYYWFTPEEVVKILEQRL